MTLRRRRSVHCPGRVLVDLALMLTDGGEATTDQGAPRISSRFVGLPRLDVGWSYESRSLVREMVSAVYPKCR